MKAMKRTVAKQIVYRYNGDPNSEQVVNDLTGEMLPHLVGEIVTRNGKQWKVAVIREELDVKGPRAVPVHHVYLTHAA